MNTDSKEVFPLDGQAPEVWEELLTVKVEMESRVRTQESRLKPSNLLGREIFRRRFRQLCYQETPGPREALTRLQELCRQWLRPHVSTKEQIVELLVLEQFLTILPEELQAWVREHSPESGEEAVVLLEDLERELDEPQHEVVAHTQGQEVLSEEVPVGAPTPLSLQSRPQESQLTCDTAQQPHAVGETDAMTKAEDRELVLRKDCPKTVASHGEIFYGQTLEESPRDPQHGEPGDPAGWEAGRWGGLRGERRHKCDACGKSFAQSAGLVRHRGSQPGRGRTSVRSAGRPSVGARVSSTTRGIHNGTEAVPLRVVRQGLQPERGSHPAPADPQGREGPIMCGQCGRATGRRRVLIEHQRSHTGERPHRCPPVRESFKPPLQPQPPSQTHVAAAPV
ncbi:zinc finger and SCAN domain-containing protein 9 [Lutra lutra]|uniref:zinc finger and SCAN domain-containing protein 9 n=1 Tax=Lutra lutra TaxID=9657 RepID=UPI001FD3FD00|nr:zinc finger and SCAN domain-containing protein 9 [Lutra lutra]